MSKVLRCLKQSFSTFHLRALTLLIVAMTGSANVWSQSGGQYGLEDSLLGGWTPGGTTESALINNNAAYNRTGNFSLAFTTSSASTNKYWYSNTPFGTSASGTYVHYIFWALASGTGTTIDASMRYGSTNPPSGTGSTANATATAISTSTWTRLSYNAGNSNGRYYFSAPRRNSGNATTFYIDDVVMYLSSSNATDLTDPATPTSLSGSATGSTVNLGWTSNTDAGTGVQSTIILRTSNLSATAPNLNDQALYSTTGGAAGPSTSGSWTIVSTTTGATATSYSDASVPTGTYLYAVVLRDLAYNYSLSTVSSSITVGTASPTITTNLTGFTSAFGNVVAGANSAPQQYSVSGAALTNNIVITAPADFQVSTSSSTGFGTSVTLTQSGGIVSATPIYVRYAPAAATGASGSLSITNSSTGATAQNVTVSGNALAVEPTSAGSISFSTIGSTSLVINLPTTGNGSKRIIVARQGSAVSFTPADAVSSTGVNANFSLATDQGSGNKIVYDGSGSGASLLTLSGLSSGTTYYFTVYEYNEGSGTSQNYLLSPVAASSVSTIIPIATITTVPTGFNGAFGNIVAASNSVPQSYTVSAINLTSNLSVNAPTDFQVSLTTATGYASALSIAPVSGTVATTTIYVRYSPAAATGASGSLNISNSSTGATAQTVAVSGNALAVEPTTAGSISFGTTTTTSIVTNLPTTGNGSKRIIVVKAGITPTFTPTDGIAIAGVNSDFSLAADQGGGNKVVYDGSGSGTGLVTVTGLTPGTQYYFVVFEYNEGTGTSQNYLPSPAASGSASTAGLPSPAIVLNQSGFTGIFGNVASGSNSTVQQYTASGTNLTANMIITAPAGFQVSLAAASGFGSSVTLTPSSGTVAITSVYVRFSPTTATGSTGNLSITNTSTGAVAQNATVTGNALDVEPTTSGSITFGAVTSNSIVINLPTVGNGSRRIIVAHAATAVSFTPTDALAISGVNANFTTATDQGSGNKVVYDGTGSGPAVVTTTGLALGTTYYFTVFEYNTGTGTSQNYLISPAATANIITNVPSITLNQTGFSGSFGNVAAGANSAEQQYVVNGANLTGNITITAPADFQVSFTTGSGFGTSLSIIPSGSTATSNIYVRYAPAAPTGATGSLIISHSSTGAATQNVTVSGNALAAKPSTAGTISFSTVTGTSLSVNLPTIGNGSKRIIVANASAPVSFVPADGVTVSGVNANFTTATNQGSGNKVVYSGTGSGSSVVAVTGLAAATKYYFTVYEYNEGTSTSQSYLLSPVASDTISTATPTIAIIQTGFSGLFGNVVTGTNSAVQSYSVSGTALTANILISAPAGFQVSASATTGFGATLSLTQTGGTVAATTVYVRYSPTSAFGATGSLLASHTSAGATTQNVTVSGNALATKPTTSGTITFGTITSTAIVVNLPTTGNGTHRIIVARAGSAVSFTPSDGVAVAGVNSVFSTATDQGGGNKVIYDGNGSGTGLVTLSALSSGTTYHFAVYSYNVGTGTSQNYLTSSVPTGNATTAIPPVVIGVNTSGFNGAFGDVVGGTSSAVRSYTVNGSALTSSINITAPTDFEISTNSGSGFSSAISLAPAGGIVASTTIYVRYSPAGATGASGSLNIVHSATGTASQNVSVSGTAMAIKPSVAGTISFGIVQPTSIQVHLPTVGNGARRIIVANLGSPPTYVPADGPQPSGVNANYTLATAQSGSGKIIYDGSGSGNNVVTVTGLTLGMLYYFVVYEYNSGTGASYSYLINPAANSNMTTYLDATRIRNNAAIAARIRIYPNPAQEEIKIEAPLPVNAIITDAAGRIVYNQKDVKKINLGAFAEGMYMIRVTDTAGNILKHEKISRVK